MKRLLLPLLLLALPALADERLTFTVVGIDCAGCAGPITKQLKAVDGVKSASVDWKAGTATVELADGVDKQKLRTAITDLGFEAIFPGEARRDLEALPADVIKTLDIAELPGTKKVDVKALPVKGKITILDVYADWCGPCKVLETRLQRYMQANSGIALRRVNIGKWDNEAAKQATREFRAEGLPYIRVYDRNGKFVADVTGGMWDEVLAAVDKAGR
jgi:copper chaperone CopZ